MFSLHFDCHPDEFFVIPSICILRGECANPACNRVHYTVAFQWLVFGMRIAF